MEWLALMGVVIAGSGFGEGEADFGADCTFGVSTAALATDPLTKSVSKPPDTNGFGTGFRFGLYGAGSCLKLGTIVTSVPGGVGEDCTG